MKRWLGALSGAADGAMIVDPEGCVTFWNHAAERLLGFKAGKVIGRPCHEVLCGSTFQGQPPCSPTCTISTKLARGGAVRNFDMQCRTKGGRTVWLNISSLAVPSGRKGAFFAVHLFRDISRWARARQLEQKLHMAMYSHSAVPELDPPLPQQDPHPKLREPLPLSKREREVLCLLAQGHSGKAIADILCISPTTVRNHIQHILEKLGCHSRLQALAIAFHPSQCSLF